MTTGREKTGPKRRRERHQDRGGERERDRKREGERERERWGARARERESRNRRGGWHGKNPNRTDGNKTNQNGKG